MSYDIRVIRRFLQVYARSPGDLTSGTAILRSCIVEQRRDVAPGNEETLLTPKFGQFIEQKKTEFTGEMIFRVAEDGRYATPAH